MSHLFQRVLVTGGCGFVGTELVSQLLARGYEVVVADDLSNPQSQAKPGYEFFHVDLRDKEKSRPAFEGVQACIALASSRGAIGYVHRHPSDIIVNNNLIYNTTFESAVEAKIQRLVFVSSSMVYESSASFPSREPDVTTMPIPISVFGRSKLIGEWYCQAFQQKFDLPYTIIRPSNVYGINELPGEQIGDTHVIPDLFKKITSGQYPVEILGNGQQTRCFIHITDLARGIIMALENDRAINEDFNMGGTEEIPILDLARMIWELCGIDKEFWASHKPGFPQDVQRQFLDISKAQRLLSWQPRIPFWEGLREVIEWLLRHNSKFRNEG